MQDKTTASEGVAIIGAARKNYKRMTLTMTTKIINLTGINQINFQYSNLIT
jgi:hypothetical protein